MDKLLIRKDVFEDMIEKGYGKRDYSKLTKKVITDKNGHKRTVFVKNDVTQTTQKQPKAQELSEEKRAKYEEMLEKVKRGPEERALFAQGDFLNKKDAIAYLENKLGKKTVSSAAQGHLESDEPQNTDITAEDEARFGKQALSGLSGKRTSDKKPTQDDMKSESTSIFNEEMEENNTTAKTFEDAIKNYNFTDEKKNQFAMDEIAKFYPELKETVDKHRKAFHDVDDAKRKLGINPNNKEYQGNFKNAVNELSKMNKEYESKAAKALEKTPNIPKPSFEKYMDARRKVDKFKETYKKQLEEFEVGERLRANGGAAFLNPMYGLKPNDYTKDSDYINAQMTIRAYEGK